MSSRPGSTDLLSVISSLMVGVILTIAPWTTLWESNFVLPYAQLRVLLLNPFARGTVTGFGLVNIVLALHDAHRRRRESREEL